ncbi:hypothetical protein A9Q99_04360 [Gammaproteobacteria bacterium 45_16_T64]|nr:hypothetical protein A9Q99_04360 [Gammaproteobacteria bacterium 45_16_T64]
MRCVALFLLLIFAVNAQPKSYDPLVTKLPGIPVIPGATWQWVGVQMAINGIPMSIKTFEYKGTERQLERYYVSLWKSKGHGQYKAKDWGRYKIIGHELDGFYSTVQYRKEGKVIRGKLVVTEIATRHRNKQGTQVPKPPASNVISVVESRDAGKRSETVTFDSNKDVDFNIRYYENQYKNENWGLVFSQDVYRRSSVRHFQKGSQLVQVTVKLLPGQPKNKSHIMVHWIK